jgi:hypothetical protein
MKYSRIIKPHSKGCRCKGKKNEWSGIIKKDPFYGSYLAVPKKTSQNHLWYVVVCNDPDCEGEKAVHSSVLANA